MGHAYNESYIEFGRRRRINYCNKLFSSWEFSVTDENTARLKRAQIRREFEVCVCVCVVVGGMQQILSLTLSLDSCSSLNDRTESPLRASDTQHCTPQYTVHVH